MNKLRAASRVPRSRIAPPIRTPPRGGRLGGLALLCTHVWALANVRKTGYAGISVFASACSLFIQICAHDYVFTNMNE
jgi:hypothetical protein